MALLVACNWQRASVIRQKYHKAVMRASFGQDQWRTIIVANHKTSRTYGPANSSFKPEFYFVLSLFLLQVLEAKRVAMNCQPNDDSLLNTPILIKGPPELNPLKTSYACKYVKSGFIHANVAGENKVPITRIRKIVTTVMRDFAPLQAAAIAQHLWHNPKTLSACYELPKRAKKSI